MEIERKVEDELKELIIERYGTITNFANKIGVSKSTMHSILQRGVGNANVQNIIKICKVLQISTDELAKGKIVYKKPKEEPEEIDIEKFYSDLKFNAGSSFILDGEELSRNEMDLIYDALEVSIEIIKKRRSKITEKMRQEEQFRRLQMYSSEFFEKSIKESLGE